MYIKHSKFKNTGILFELLVRKITADTLAGTESPSVNILKKYFVNTELGKEYKLYETLFKSKNLTEGKANTILTTILESSKKLNRKALKREKYNLVKEFLDTFPGFGYNKERAPFFRFQKRFLQRQPLKPFFQIQLGLLQIF